MIASKINDEGAVKSTLLDAPDHRVAELADGRYQVTLAYPNGCVVTHVCDAYTMQLRLAATPGMAKVAIDAMKLAPDRRQADRGRAGGPDRSEGDRPVGGSRGRQVTSLARSADAASVAHVLAAGRAAAARRRATQERA